MKATPLLPHHTLEELERLYKEAKNPLEHARWQIIWLKKKGYSIAELMAVSGYSRKTVSCLIADYNARQERAIEDKRKHNGARTLLSPQQQDQLAQVLKTAREDGLPWTSERVRLYIEQQFGIKMTHVCAWGYMNRLGVPSKKAAASKI